MNSEFDRSEFEVKPARSKQILASLVCSIRPRTVSEKPAIQIKLASVKLNIGVETKVT